MNIVTVEFTGTPEAGKTDCIQAVKNTLMEAGYTVDYIQESAELVPKEIPKGNFDGHLWMRLHSLENILVERHNECDVLLIDRGIIDGIFYTYLFLSNNPKNEKECDSLIRFLSELTFYNPDFLFVFTCEAEVSIQRRGGEGRLVTLDYIQKYNKMLSNFIPTISVPYKVIDTSKLSKEEVCNLVTKEIKNLLKKEVS